LIGDLLQALEASDITGATKAFEEKRSGGEALEIHRSLFPFVQRVLNPPFINPHLPKMYRIYRELIPYLERDEIPAFIHLEVTEYARRPKLQKLPKTDLPSFSVSFSQIESGIREQDLEKTATLMATFYSQKGGKELARRLLLLGSGYLDDSLGHSISCTAFMLLEMLERKDEDPWPVLATLAGYFCKGQFHTTPALRKLKVFPPDEAIKHHLSRATSGRGIVDLHHTITLYAIERTRHLFSQEEYHHLIGAWIAFMGNKRAKEVVLESRKMDSIADYSQFYEIFSKMDVNLTLSSVAEMIPSPEGRKRLGRFFVKGLCDLYRGNYNPHYLTGLGSALWVVGQYWNQGPLAVNALYQYVDFFFNGIKSQN
jgi:hypothetical protein